MIGSPAEHAVLGACMATRDSFRFAAEVITAEDFSHPELGELFSIIRRLIEARIDPSLVSVVTEAKQSRLRAVSASDIASWLNTPDNAGSVGYWAGIVRDDALRRRLSTLVGQSQSELTDPATSPGTVLTGLANQLENLRAGTAGQDLDVKLLGEVMDVPDEFDWLIPGLLERKDRVVVTAGEGAGKTTFIRQMAIASGSGVNPITFQQMPALRVLVVDAENTERQWRRQAAGMVKRGQLKGTGDPAETVALACSPRMNITSDRWLGAIHRVIDRHEPDMVCIGPLYRLVQGPMNSEEDMAGVLSALDTIRDRNLALIVEAHAGHSKNTVGDRELRPRGSSALMGWPEFGFGLALDPNEGGKVYLQRWRGDREERLWPEAFQRGGPWPWTDALMLDVVRQEAY